MGSLAAAGVRLAIGSDAPVAPPSPLDGMRAAHDRRTDSGDVIPGRPLDIDIALAAHTRGAAHAAWSEHDQGRIAPGMRADMALLDGAIGATDARVYATILNSTVLWRTAGNRGEHQR
jgi:predicted amidohydrolase YtcJ